MQQLVLVDIDVKNEYETNNIQESYSLGVEI